MTKEEKLAKQRGKLLWCVHVFGPDDLIAQESYEAAERHAAELIDFLYRAESPVPTDVLCLPVVARWPWSAEAHRSALKESLKESEDGR